MTGQGVQAQLFDPNLGNEMVPGEIFPQPTMLRFQAGELIVDIPFDRLRVESDDKADGRLCFRDWENPQLRIFCSDPAIYEERHLLRCNHLRRKLQDIAGRREYSRRLKVTFYAFLAVVVLVWIGWFAFTATARSIVRQIPPEWEKKYGDKEIAELRKKVDFLDDTNLVMQLIELTKPLAQVIPGKQELQFYVVDKPFPNAFALPGGHVIVTTSLIRFVDRPEQLLGVLAHELAHVSRRHGFQQAVSGAGPVLLLEILLSDRNNRMSIVGEISGALIYQNFSQNLEREADDVGWSYLVAANVDPRGMIEVFEKFKQEIGDEPSYLQKFNSHPAIQKRIDRLQARWDKLPQKTNFLILTNQLQEMQRTIR